MITIDDARRLMAAVKEKECCCSECVEAFCDALSETFPRYVFEYSYDDEELHVRLK